MEIIPAQQTIKTLIDRSVQKGILDSADQVLMISDAHNSICNELQRLQQVEKQFNELKQQQQ